MKTMRPEDCEAAEHPHRHLHSECYAMLQPQPLIGEEAAAVSAECCSKQVPKKPEPTTKRSQPVGHCERSLAGVVERTTLHLR
jgi:hypothetical protein